MDERSMMVCNFVTLSEWQYPLANNGGLNSFLTSTYGLDAHEVLGALSDVRESKAESQLEYVLDRPGTALPASSQGQLWNAIDQFWTDSFDEFDTLSSEAENELMSVFGQHVQEHETFYLGLVQRPLSAGQP